MKRNLSIIFKIIIVFTIFFSQIRIEAEEELEFGGIKCGTLLPKEKQKQKCDKIQFKDSLSFQAKFVSESGRFILHYDTTGADAVPREDLNKNGIPDYIDSASHFFDMAYRLYVDTIGYPSPIKEKIISDEDRYKVYIMDIGNGEGAMYGVTFTASRVNVQSVFPRYYSHIYIDNDYSPSDSAIVLDGTKKRTYYETEINALKITIAHEFHHAIQFICGLDPSAQTLMEMTSTFMEWRFHRDTYDYMQFVRNLFKNLNIYTFGSNSADAGYRYAIFGHYIYKKYGDIILKRMWDKIAEGTSGYSALDEAFREQGTDLLSEWRCFLPWIYYTGRRAKGVEYFDKAAEYPEMTFYRDEKFKNPSFLEKSELKSFEIRGYRCHLPSNLAATDDTLDLLFSNLDLEAVLFQRNSSRSFNFDIGNEYKQDSKQLGSTDYFYHFPKNNYVFDSIYLSSGFPTEVLSYCYPNPLKLSEENEIFFPAPELANLDAKDFVDLVVYNAEMNEVYSKKSNIDVDLIESSKGNKVVKWSNIPSNLSSGVYIYRIIFKEQESVGKFVIINN